jgi:hypothetical protein
MCRQMQVEVFQTLVVGLAEVDMYQDSEEEVLGRISTEVVGEDSAGEDEHPSLLHYHRKNTTSLNDIDIGLCF